MRTADRGNHFLKYHILGKDSFTVLADREAAPGEQLFEDYGDNDNSVYAQHHGFVAVNNPFECVVPKLPPLKTSDKSALGFRFGFVCVPVVGLFAVCCI
jgi:hypothetical protein